MVRGRRSSETTLVSRRYTNLLHHWRCSAATRPPRRREVPDPCVGGQEQLLQVRPGHPLQPSPLLDGKEHGCLYPPLGHDLGSLGNGTFEKLAEPRFRILHWPSLAHDPPFVNVTSVTVPRSGGRVGGLTTENTFRTPAWNELRKLDVAGRLSAIQNPDTRARLVGEVKAGGVRRIEAMKNWFYMGNDPRPCYTQDLSQNLVALGEAAGEHPVEVWLRISDETDGKALFHMRGFNFDLDALAKLLCTEWVIPGLGDAGAHVSQVIDSGWTTFLLSHWHRDNGLYSLPEAVHRISAVPADVLGLDDRGTLGVGKRADINVFDIDRLQERMPETVHDFPFGAPRFIQRAVGYHATVCNGTVVLRDDELTGEYGGRVLRNCREQVSALD